MEEVKRFLKSLLSRKFLLAIVGGVVAFGNSYWEWGLTTKEVWSILVPILSYIGIEGLADVKGR